MHDSYLPVEVWIADICYSICLLQKQPFPGFGDFISQQSMPFT